MTLKHKKRNFEALRNPFAVDVETAPVQIQMELIELQCNRTLKAKCDTAGPAQFIHSIPEAMPQLRLHAARTLCMFGSTYLCEKLFSVMKINKLAHRSRLTDEHLQSILRISTTQNLTLIFLSVFIHIYVQKTFVCSIRVLDPCAIEFGTPALLYHAGLHLLLYALLYVMCLLNVTVKDEIQTSLK